MFTSNDDYKEHKLASSTRPRQASLCQKSPNNKTVNIVDSSDDEGDEDVEDGQQQP